MRLRLLLLLLLRLHLSCAATFRAAAKLNKICVASKREFSVLHLLLLLLLLLPPPPPPAPAVAVAAGLCLCSSHFAFSCIFFLVSFWRIFNAYDWALWWGWAWHRFALSNAICSWLCQLEQYYLHFLFCPNAQKFGIQLHNLNCWRVVVVCVVVAVVI